MPKAYDTWTVLPHRPIEKLEPNLWRVQGELPKGNGARVMTIAKLEDGSVAIHNAIALEEEHMKEIEDFGKPSIIAVPNGFHRLDAKVFKARYPTAKVICPAGARKKVEQVVAVDGSYDDAPKDPTVRFRHLEGIKQHEGLMEVRSASGTTLVLNDSVNNLPKIGGVFGLMLSPTGRPSVPRMFRWAFVKDKSAFQADIEKLASTGDLRRVVVSHGAVMDAKPADDLRTALTAF